MNKITKDTVLTTVQATAAEAKREDYKVDEKNPAKGLADFTSRYDRELQSASHSLDKYLRNKGSNNPSYVRRILAGIEALQSAKRYERDISKTIIKAGESINMTPHANITQKEKKVIKVLNKDVKAIQKSALKAQKRISQRKENGQKLGDSISEYRKMALSMVQEIVRGKEVEVVVAKYLDKQGVREL